MATVGVKGLKSIDTNASVAVALHVYVVDVLVSFACLLPVVCVFNDKQTLQK